MWNPSQLLRFVNDVLEWMQQFLKENRDVHYCFQYDPNQKIIAARVCDDGDLVESVRSALDM